ncbi:MAG TPA: efflux RND transporter periplasmic adaptor subunit, partial [Ktedonobacterales bacterium]|nr:efflux RND transporter periplasmic adaptor subunit [Ktedonobacterales bacterium]
QDKEQAAIAKCNGSTSCIQNAQDAYAAVQAEEAAQVASAQEQVDYWQGKLNSAQAALQTAQDNLNNSVLYAPHGGTIATINGSVGGRPGDVPNGQSTGVFIQIVDLSQLQVSALVNEKYVGSVAAQNLVHFTVDTYGSRVFQGTVSGVNPEGVSSGGAVNYPVLIDVDSQGFDANGIHLLPGMHCQVTIITQQRTNVLVVPVAALRFAQRSAPQSGKGLLPRKQIISALSQAQQLELNLVASGVDLSQEHPIVTYLVGYQKGKYVALPVVLGLTNGQVYEVLAGLKLGEVVVTGQASGGL